MPADRAGVLGQSCQRRAMPLPETLDGVIKMMDGTDPAAGGAEVLTHGVWEHVAQVTSPVDATLTLSNVSQETQARYQMKPGEQRLVRRTI
jgi:hypothetical protein